MHLLGIATAQADCAVTQPAAAKMAVPLCCRSDQQRRLLPALYRRSQVERRSTVLVDTIDDAPVQSFFHPAVDAQDKGPTTQQRMLRYSTEARHLAVRAGAAALAEASMPPGRITHLITVSCTGFEAPGFDVTLIKQLKLSPSVARTHVGFMGCHGALNGLRMASAFVDADPAAVPLLCAVELCSLHFQYGWDPQQLVANALFADGAAATIGVAALNADREVWRLAASGSYLIPDCEDAMTWRIADHGFVMTLSTRVPELIGQHLRPWLKSWLADHDLSVDQIGSWAIHPGGPRIVSAVAEALDLPDALLAPSRRVLAECGNMSSPTVLFILERLGRDRAPRPCVALGFGPGLAVETALFF